MARRRVAQRLGLALIRRGCTYSPRLLTTYLMMANPPIDPGCTPPAWTFVYAWIGGHWFEAATGVRLPSHVYSPTLFCLSATNLLGSVIFPLLNMYLQRHQNSMQ